MYLFIQEFMALGLNFGQTLDLYVCPTLGQPLALRRVNMMMQHRPDLQLYHGQLCLANR